MRAASDYALVSTWRKLSLVGGIISVALGIILLAWPRSTLLVVGALVGVWLLVLGGTRMADAATGGHLLVSSREHPATTWQTRLLRGLAGAIYAATGIVLLSHLNSALKFLAVVLGILWICAGFSEALIGFARVGGPWVRRAALATGILNLVLGATMLLWPNISLRILVWILALWLIALGAIQLYSAFLAHRLEHELRMGSS